MHNVILNKLGKRDYPISKSKTNFVTLVRLKYSPLIHSKSETISTPRQILAKLRNSEKIFALKGTSIAKFIHLFHDAKMLFFGN